jgi:hypothetical protein
MLPIESFVDVVSFLGYYDLGGLKLANKLLSAVAHQCADAIRLFDFSDLSFSIYDNWIRVCRLKSGGRSHWACNLRLTSEENLGEFVAEAFRNCTVGRLLWLDRREKVGTAIRAVASTVVVADTLDVSCGPSESVQELIEYLDGFRLVKVWARKLF